MRAVMRLMVLSVFLLAVVGKLSGAPDGLPDMRGALGGGGGGGAAQVTTADDASNAVVAARAAYAAGWRGQDLVQAVAYGYIESTLHPTAVSSTGCEGWLQTCPPRAGDLDPQGNAVHAHEKWAACDGGSWRCDWDPYDGGPSNPRWATGYALGLQAVKALPGGGA